MGKKVESWQSDDGVLFTSERAMVLHEVKVALNEKFPALKVSVPIIIDNIDEIYRIVTPVSSVLENHPEAAPETTHDLSLSLAIDSMCAHKQAAHRFLALIGCPNLKSWVESNPSPEDIGSWYLFLSKSGGEYTEIADG